MKISEIYIKKQHILVKHPASMQDCYVSDSRAFGDWIKRRRLDPKTKKKYTTYEIYGEELEELLKIQEVFKNYKEIESLLIKLNKLSRSQ